MATLSGQSISDTYDGLLKLQNSTQGITSSLQPIEDGLGNNTGARIGTNLFTSPNVVNMNVNNLKPDSMGVGFAVTGSINLGSGSQNNLLFNYFYDTGVHSYSSVTVNVTTQTTTSDTLEILFYDLQFVKDYGLFPRSVIMSGITIPTSPIGLQTVTLPSTLSFSGTGGGFYAIVFKVQNANVAPTVRFSSGVSVVNNQSYAFSLGFVRNNLGTGQNVANRASSFNGQNLYFMTNQTTPALITEADVISRFNTTVGAGPLGFALNVIK